MIAIFLLTSKNAKMRDWNKIRVDYLAKIVYISELRIVATVDDSCELC